MEENDRIRQKLVDDYWIKKLSGVALSDVQADLTLSSETVLENEAVETINQLSGNNYMAEYTVCLAAYVVLIRKYFNAGEMIIRSELNTGSAHHRTLLFRIRMNGDSTLKELLQQVKAEIQESHNYAGFDKKTIFDYLKGNEAAGETIPFFEFQYNSVTEVVSDHACEMALLINTHKEEQKIQLFAPLNSDSFLFSKSFEQSYNHQLATFKQGIDLAIKSKSLTGPSVEAELIKIACGQTIDIPEGANVITLFESQAALHPNSIACIHNGEKITYKELAYSVDKLVYYILNECQLPVNSRVALLADRSINTYSAILAIIKSGHAFIPLDVTLPAERIRYILNDASVGLVITESNYIYLLEDYSKELFALDIQLDTLEPGPESAPPLNGTQSAYIIYTSGSTGQPKGCEITHNSLTNYILWAKEYYFAKECRANMAWFTPLSFDLTLTSIFSPIISGCTLSIYDHKEDAGITLKAIFNDDAVTDTVKLTPAHLGLLPALEITKTRIGQLIVGGEQLNKKQIAGIKKPNPGLRIVNEYGPTEATIGCIVKEIKDNESVVTIGFPISNMQAYILDEDMQLLPADVKGEICLGGAGLAKGYLNREQLSAEKFVAHPFIKGERLYKTGDIGRRLGNGEIVFIGRKDNQVKINGFRIELNEIEQALLKHPQIKEAVVDVRQEEDQERHLVAYYISDDLEDSLPVRQFLKEELPAYMIPQLYIKTDSIPLTANGKVNIAALRKSNLNRNTNTYEPPQNELQSVLVQIWQEVLGVSRIGINDDFFKIKGDSIKSIQIASRLRKYGYKMDLSQLFENPTIKKLGFVLTKTTRVPSQSVIEGAVPLTPIQHAFFEEDQTNFNHYNQSVLLKFPAAVSREMTDLIFGKLQEHHDALRMTYDKKANEWQQYNNGLKYPLHIEEFDLREYTAEIALNKLENESTRLQESIDLKKGPMLHLGLFHLEDGDRLLIIVHHLVMDGVSWRILFEDLETLCGQYYRSETLELTGKTDSFLVWAESLKNYAASESLKAEAKYWNAVDEQITADLPKDFAAEKGARKSQEMLSFSLDEAQTESLLTKANLAYNTEINDILIAALCLAMKKKFNVGKIAITLEGHGREDIIEDMDISRTIGWFTSTYPVVISMHDDKDVSRHLKLVKETLHRVPHKGIGYGILRYMQAVGADKQRLKPEINFNYLGQFGIDTNEKAFAVSNDPKGKDISDSRAVGYALDIVGIVGDNKLSVGVIYDKELYKEQTIQELCNLYEASLTELIRFCCEKNVTELTPSDFDYKHLMQEELDTLFDSAIQSDRTEGIKNVLSGQNIQNIYTLSPMQESMLFHNLLNPDSSMYLEQASFRVSGTQNVSYIKKSYDLLTERHAILRTIFNYNDLQRPVQVVLKERDNFFKYLDLREGLPADMENVVKAYKEKDLQEPFNLFVGPLMRLSVLQLKDDEYELIWTHHHILMDGWCMSILIPEFMSMYKSFISGTGLNLPLPNPYNYFIQWLEKRDKSSSKEYWKQYLAGYAKPASFNTSDEANSGYDPGEVLVEIAASDLSGLELLATDEKVTLSTILQSLWGILISRLSNVRDVVFGTIVSGRPSEIPGIETMVGLFINTIPVRVNYDDKVLFNDLIKTMQLRALESQSHHHFPLAEIQADHVLKQQLVDHILVFENYPIGEQLMRNNSENSPQVEFDVVDFNVVERTNYNIVVSFIQQEKLYLKFNYNKNVYAPDLIDRMIAYYETLIGQIIKSKTIVIADMELLAKSPEVFIQGNDVTFDF